ncbi:hypothetical protein AB0H43_02880 [Hamadaea sp. NPDC050747]|uniref:hypothetical protein n=1 Tax=Hamadaea sp. NPDC050747 TaxID=3155789 RepID=UPI0033F64DFA
MATGLRRVGHWRNGRWGWGQRHIWLYVSEAGAWWVYVRVGTSDAPRETWRQEYPTEEAARQAVGLMMARAEAKDGDRFSYFEPEARRTYSPDESRGSA